MSERYIGLIILNTHLKPHLGVTIQDTAKEIIDFLV